MSRRPLNKSALARAERDLATYERFLPALDLKRQQLMAERARARRELEEAAEAAARAPAEAADRLPMLANRQMELSGLVRLKRVSFGSENVAGTRLPTLAAVEVEAAPYGFLGRPHWVDRLVEELRRAIETRVAHRVAQERVERLEAAVRTVTQRVNLFDKVLIPRTRADIARIRIFLGDAEKAAVVRSKIAKSKHARVEGPRP